MKPLPRNIDTEKAILGAMIMNPKCVPKVAGLITASDFYHGGHKVIAKACFKLKSNLDIVSLVDTLRQRNLLGKCGGQDYIVSLVEQIATSAGVENWCRIVKAYAQRRQIISLCQTISDNSILETNHVSTVLSELKTGIREIEKTNQTTIRSNDDLVRQLAKELETSEGEHNIGVLTGLGNIDRNLNGLEPKTTYYIIAESGMAKSALALNIGDYIALNYDGKVPYFSLESTSLALMRRRLAKHSKVALTRIRRRNINDNNQYKDIVDAFDVIDEPNLILIDDPHFQTVEALISFCESLAMEKPISLIIIDYIQLLESSKQFTSRHHEISYISKLISFLAKNLNVPIIVISQLGKDVEKRHNREPMISDIKESGDIRNLADNVISIYADKTEETQFYVKIKALKGKDTGRWTTWLHFNGNYQTFEDCEDQYEAPIVKHRGFRGE